MFCGGLQEVAGRARHGPADRPADLHDDVVLVVGRRHGVIAAAAVPPVAVEEGVHLVLAHIVLLALHLRRGRGHDLKRGIGTV